MKVTTRSSAQIFAVSFFATATALFGPAGPAAATFDENAYIDCVQDAQTDDSSKDIRDIQMVCCIINGGETTQTPGNFLVPSKITSCKAGTDVITPPNGPQGNPGTPPDGVPPQAPDNGQGPTDGSLPLIPAIQAPAASS